MDAKMKGMILSGMMALCLILGILAVLGSTWLVPAGDDAEEMEDGDMEASYGLNTFYQEYPMSSMFATMDQDGNEMSDEELEETCKEILKGYEKADAEGECDGEVLSVSWSISDMCEDEDYMGDDDAKDDCESQASAGTMGTIGMWGGIVCALLAALILVLPMAGVDALDAMPDMAKTIVSWAAGGLMLLGILLWYIMLPDTDAETGLGMSGMMAIGAAVLGLGASAMDQFMPAEE